MKYTEKTLTGNEKIVYEANVDWFIFVPGVLLVLSGLYMYGNLTPFSKESDITPAGTATLALITHLLFLFLIIKGTINLIRALFYKISTELVITSKRVIFKTGFIKRSTVELTSKQMESLSFDQGIFGRIFNFGDISIYGTGGGVTPIYDINNPLIFRNKATELIDRV